MNFWRRISLRHAGWALGFVCVWSVTTEARADRVVLFSPGGSAAEVRRLSVETLMTSTLRDLGHDVVSGAGIQHGSVSGVPTTEAQMVEVANANQALWVVTSEVNPLAGQYRLHVTAGYTLVRRVESLEVNVVVADEQARIRDVLQSMIRAPGLGDDALRLTEEAAPANPQTDAQRAEAEREARERAQREAEAAAARTALAEREAARARDEAAAREHDFENRPRYGADPERPWIGQVGLGMISLASHDAARAGGFLWNMQFRVGHGFASAPGLELRGGFDIVGGAASGFALNVGGVYLGSFFAAPVYIGGGAELGLFLNTTGARDAGLLLRASAIVSWRVGPRFFLEGLLPEISYLSLGGGIVGIGLSVRAGVRF
ncbi:MAG: hypothetical protein IPK60_13510 [Sandaracinaceae bacterium]|nr:hypothetical protein [Sandaracinaceae bacterium]